MDSFLKSLLNLLQYCFFFFFNKLFFKIVFIYFWLHQVFVVAWGGYSLAVVFALLVVVASLVVKHWLQACGLQ